jgi:outer membrane usher protein
VSYDSINETTRAEIRRARGLELPEVDYRIGAVNTPVSTDVTAAAGFTNTRFAAQGQIDSRVSGPDAPDLLTGRLQSGIAFVDGTFGVSRDPGRGFYMFRRHETLRDAQIDIRSGSIGRTRARADAFGPGIVPVLQPYREEQLQLFVRNAPAGYNLGEGRYTLVPGARSGASIMIGDDAFRTAVATLIADGEPVQLRYGSLTNLDTGGQSVFFTNRVGRAAFNDLAAGRYRAVIGDDGAAFEFTIGVGDEAFVDLGTITLEHDQ